MDSPVVNLHLRRRPAPGLSWMLLLLILFSAAASLAGEKVFGGVGLQVVPTTKGELVVLNVVEGMPAAEEGILPGDLIVQVDGHPLAGSDFSEIVSSYLWGEAGTMVTLKYLRPGKEGLHSATLQRVPLNTEVDSPAGVRMLTPGNR